MSTLRMTTTFMITMVVASLLLIACGGAQSQEPIKLGWIGALSGPSAVVGQWETHGIELVIDEANARGGVCGGRKLQFIKYDDGADPAKSINWAQKLINEDKILFVFATTNSHTSLAVLPIFTNAKIGQMTGALSADITAKGSAYIFRDVGAGPAFESTLIDYLVGEGFTKFALISDSAAYGKGQADYQQAAIRNYELQSLIRETYNMDDTDFVRQLTNIIDTDPEIVLLGGTAVPSGLIAKQARQLGFTGQIAGGVSIGTPKFIEVAGEAAEGVIFTSPYIDNDANDMTRDFAKRYQAKWGYEPEQHGAKGYDGAMMMVEAINRSCNNLTGEEIARQLHTVKNYQGLQGTFTYQESGESISQVQLGIIKAGQLTAIKE